MSRAKMTRLITLAALLLAMMGWAALPASASARPAQGTAAAVSGSVSRNPSTLAGKPGPEGTYNNLYFCDYTINYDNIALWKWPGGANRTGNSTDVRVLKGVAFNSIPWISTGTINGQRWIYGTALIPSSSGGGSIEYIYGWVGIDYLTHAIPCGYDYFSTSNQVTTGTHYGDPFASEPAETSASYQGQTWVFGEDPYANGNTGWIGRNYLTLDSCNSSGCYYSINASNIREWILPGGADGP